MPLAILCTSKRKTIRLAPPSFPRRKRRRCSPPISTAPDMSSSKSESSPHLVKSGFCYGIKRKVRSCGKGNGQPEVWTFGGGDCRNSNMGKRRHIATLRETVFECHDYARYSPRVQEVGNRPKDGRNRPVVAIVSAGLAKAAGHNGLSFDRRELHHSGLARQIPALLFYVSWPSIQSLRKSRD